MYELLVWKFIYVYVFGKLPKVKFSIHVLMNVEKHFHHKKNSRNKILALLPKLEKN